MDELKINPETVELTTQDFNSAAMLLAEAFYNNPYKVIPSQFPALLMTQKESSVRFYRQLGFEIAHRSLIGQDRKAFTNWYLFFKVAT